MDFKGEANYALPDFRKISKRFEEKLKKIKVLAFDIDGILTNGHIIFDGDHLGFNRYSHTRDGYGLRMMMKEGFEVGVISGGYSIGVTKRYVDNLQLNFAYLGTEDKRDAYKKILDKGFSDEEILYMGDEFFDIPLLKRCGFSATAPTSGHEVQEIVDYVTFSQAGMGCAREVMDLVRYAQGIVPYIPDFEHED